MVRARLKIREIQQADNMQVGAIIREVLLESGAPRKGTAYADPSLDKMFEAYQGPGCRYWVIADGDRVCGGGGIGPLLGSDPHTCELQKMYFKKELRGLGLGKEILGLAIEFARTFGYRSCYLETMTYMDRALKLYRRYGFESLDRPMGETGHTACEVWMQKIL
jgi:putative acetyltransferase